MVDICFCSDSNFLKPLEISVFSILVNSKVNIKFHIIKASDFDESNLKTLVSKFGSEIYFYEMNIDLPAKGRFSKAMYGRLYMADILPVDVQKIIYLDCDVVVNKCLSELWMLDMRGSILGAVPESTSIIKKALIKKFGLADYFNSGVLVVNLGLVRNKSKFRSAIRLVEERGDSFEYPDQDALNIAFANEWSKIDVRFNYMGLDFCSEAVIVHYALSKPWDNRLNKNSHFYHEYARNYPYFLPYFKYDYKKESRYSEVIRMLVHPLRYIYWSWIK